MGFKCYRTLWIAVLAVVLTFGLASAQVAQDIVVDGVNDFALANRVEDDSLDTEYPELDLGEIYVTNNAINLFIGYGYDTGTWGSNQIGIAIDVGTPEGGLTDPWARQIEWSTAANAPDFIVYCNLDNNWQAGYRWDGAAWAQFVTQGPGALGWETASNFGEIGILLSTLGISAGTEVGVEIWVTQDNNTRGGLDFAANDTEQLSTPDGTVFSPPVPCAASIYHPFTVISASDVDPPVVQEVRPTSQPIINTVDVIFNEPVDTATAENPANYTLLNANGGTMTLSSAVQDAAALNVVHLTIMDNLVAADDLYDLTVSAVQDAAGNPIVPGSGDQACFMIKKLVFRGQFSYYLLNSGSPPDEFSIEGDIAPLTFGTLCDTGNMTDTGVDDIWTWNGLFMVSGDCDTGTATADLQWKFAHNCTTYEPLGSNRVHTLDLATGAVDTLEFWWADEDPSDFLTHAVDVEFFVDLNSYGFDPGDIVSLNGNVPPLTNAVPSVTNLADDGTGNDLVAGDGIFSTVVRFEEGAAKNVLYKFLLNQVYECFGQGDRHVYLNEDEYGIVDSPEGPLTLPVAVYDRCGTTWAPVAVVFSVNMKHTEWHDITPSDVVSLRGTPSNTEPAVIDWDTPGLNILLDDGVYPDLAAGDLIYSTRVVFPDSSSQFTEYKYLVNEEFECLPSNRSFWIDPDNFDAAGNPQILATDRWASCDLTPVPDLATALRLSANWPNPFNPSTTIRFYLPAAGHATLRVFNAKGALVRTLRSEHLAAGSHSVVWDGRSDRGAAVSSGLYFYRLDAADQALTRRMMLLK